ncbi:MAG: hypothetical protein WC895_05560 [Candidatus Shapirobacteria bacterium]|jgi:hypothetical protein
MGKTGKGGSKKFEKHSNRNNTADECMTFSLRDAVKEATEGKVFGPECVHCHEPIDTVSNRKNGNITQGFIHVDCYAWAEKKERDEAAAETDEAIELERELLLQLGLQKQ